MTDVEKNKTPTHTSETMSDAVAMTSTASAEGMKQEEEKQFQQSARQEEALEHDIAATKKNKETEQDVEKTKAALEKTQQAAYNKQLDVVKKQHIPRIHDLDDGTPLEATIEKKAGNAASAEMLYNKIDATYKDLLEPFFVGIDGFGAREMQVVVTGLSLHLFQRFSGKQGRDREALFAQADAFKNIKEDEHFLTGIFDRGKDIAKLGGISTLLEMSGLLQFFAAFKEEDMRTALAARKGKNYYLLHPRRFQELLNGYVDSSIEKKEGKDERLVHQVKSGSFDASSKTAAHWLDKATITKEDKIAMTKDIANYGGSTEDFDHFMTYVEKAGSINTMKGSLKTASLENHKIAGWLGTLVSAGDQLKQLTGEDRALFEFIDSILEWLGFDGAKGYLQEYEMQKHVGPLMEVYVTGAEASKKSPPVFTEMLTGLTAGLTNKNTILAYAKDIDMKHLYASLAGKTKGQTKSYLVEKNLDQFLPQQNIDGESILMKPYADYSVEEKMYTVSALLLERISMQGTHDLENMDEGTLIQLMITYLIYPGKAMKEMDIGAGVAKLLREEETPDAEPPVADRNIPPVVPPASSEVTEVATHAALVEMVLNGSIDYKTGEVQRRAWLLSDPTLQIMIGLADMFPGMRVTSTVRTLEENTRLQQEQGLASSTSLHMERKAFDVGRVLDKSQEENDIYFKEIKREAELLGAHVLIHGTWEAGNRHVHIDTCEAATGALYADQAAIDAALEQNT